MSSPYEVFGEVAADVTVRKARVAAGYARFYAPLSILTFTLTFFPYYESRPDSTTPYGGLWQEVVRTGHENDVLAVLVFLAVTVLLVFAALEKLGAVGLLAAAAGALFIGIMLWTAPGFSEKPAHTDVGQFDIVLCFLSAVILVSHAIWLKILDWAR